MWSLRNSLFLAVWVSATAGFLAVAADTIPRRKAPEPLDSSRVAQTRRGSMLFVLEQQTYAYPPGGPEVLLGAGTEIDLCARAGYFVLYDMEGKVLLAATCAGARPLFDDGFE